MSDDVCVERAPGFLGNELKKEHRAEDIIRIFNQCFSETYFTELVGGNPEPEYVPAHLRASAVKDEKGLAKHAILFTKDYYASALHEISHWCIAGDARRQQLDYGYWYCPDGRTEAQQCEFEKVEVKPQALEWLFAEAAGFPFRPSFDNLNGSPVDAKGFADNVHLQAIGYLENGVNDRSRLLISALLQHYRQENSLNVRWFDRSKLGY
jgi:elongation factor P hydroxylase